MAFGLQVTPDRAVFPCLSPLIRLGSKGGKGEPIGRVFGPRGVGAGVVVWKVR